MNNESVDVAQCIRSLFLPMYLIRPLPKLPKSLAVIRSVAAQIFFIFRPKTPEPPRPSPIVGVGEIKALPAPK